jgi:hypothetical protein
VVVGVGVDAHKQFGELTQDGLRQRPLEQVMPDPQSLFVTQPLLQPAGGVGLGTGLEHKQFVLPVQDGLRQNPLEHTRPD